MQIKDQLQQTGELEGKLERMADFSFWGEARPEPWVTTQWSF